MTVTIELPESVTQELDQQQISAQQVRAFVIQAVEAWLRAQSANAERGGSRFAENATTFAETLVRENRALFERLG